MLNKIHNRLLPQLPVLQIFSLLMAGMAATAAWANAPSQPAQLQAFVYSSSSAEVMWARSTDDVIVAGYEIVINDQVLGTFDQLSYYRNDLIPGNTYRFEITAVDNQGNRSTSSAISLVAGNDDAAPVVEESTISDARIVVYSRTAAELFWTRPPNTQSTEVYRNTQRIGSSPGTSYYDGNRERDTSYTYELVALDSQGEELGRTVVGDSSATDPTTVTPPDTEPPAVTPPLDGNVFAPLASDINPDRSRYLADGYDPVNVIRVDLRTATTEGTCSEEDQSGCTLDDVLEDVEKRDDLTVDIPVHFMSDDFADDGSPSNAELRLRGGGSRFAEQKSFRIKLDSKDELWRGERFLQLNKHPFESSRQRNKLAMDLMSRVPHLPSFRTQFVNLWIDDGNGPEDYGLFTHIERSNDDYLESRGLDKDGNLYKAEEFRFALSDLENMRVDDEGEPLDEERFETSLEIEEGKDHRALANMMSALHDSERSFESVLDEYFNRNNVLAWLSTNLLLRHADGTRHNYILYNPSDTEKFYFIPWDYDAAIGRWRLPADDSYSNADLKSRINYGYSLGAENVFMENFYRLPGAHMQLLRAMAYLRQNAMDDATIIEQSYRNADLIEPYMTRLPDSEYNPEFHNSPTFENTIAWNEEAVQTRFNVPIPPTLQTPVREQDAWRFSWTPAYSPTGDSVSYDLQISSSRSFEEDNIAVELTGIDNATPVIEQLVDAARLPLQTYYVRLIARASSDPARFWVPARNRLVEDDTRYYGMIRFDTE